MNSKACTLSSSGYVECVCPARFEGNKCEVDKCLRCHGAPCLINEETGDVVCKWVLGICSLFLSLITFPIILILLIYGTALALQCILSWCICRLLAKWIDLIKSEKCIGPYTLQQFRFVVELEAKWACLLDMYYAYVWQNHHWVIFASCKSIVLCLSLASIISSPSSCTNGRIAPSCQLCDGYCYNGGTCHLDPDTNLPFCQ